MLLQKINYINKFFSEYSNVLNKTNTLLYNRDTGNNFLSITKKDVALMFKLNYIKAILDQDLLYVYYLKLLSFNTSLFKN